MTPEQTKLYKLITSYGIENAQAIVEAQAASENRPHLSQCLAMIENESTGRNVFGGEGTACLSEWYEQEVTVERAEVYMDRLEKGCTPDGVGPTQITDPALAFEARKLGGIHIPRCTCDVGFNLLHELMVEHGTEEGFRAYNGSGPDAVAYAERAMRWATIWHDRFVAHGLT